MEFIYLPILSDYTNRGNTSSIRAAFEVKIFIPGTNDQIGTASVVLAYGIPWSLTYFKYNILNGFKVPKDEIVNSCIELAKTY